METKKSQKADLKSKQLLFLEIGLVTTLGIVFSAFQWSVDKTEPMILSGLSIENFEPDLIPITRVEKPETKKAPVVKALKLHIIEDNIDFIEEPMDFSTDLVDEVPVMPIFIEPEPEVIEPEIFLHAEEMPVFPGGTQALLRFLGSETRYPALAKANGISGKVFVGFVINKHGIVEQAKILRPVDELLEREALRVVNKMPKWSPGKQRGKAVNVAYTVPITFKLQ